MYGVYACQVLGPGRDACACSSTGNSYETLAGQRSRPDSTPPKAICISLNLLVALCPGVIDTVQKVGGGDRAGGTQNKRANLTPRQSLIRMSGPALTQPGVPRPWHLARFSAIP
jgi:hypothetical protein